MSVLLSIIIVNYRTPELTIRCIDSIYNTLLDSFEIIVVDNCSNDNSEFLLKSKYPNILWINNKRNEGFGRANNLGVLNSNGIYLLFLNSDMLLLNDTVNECLDYIKSRPKVGVLGCKLLNEDSSFQKSVYYYVGDYMGVLKNSLLVDYLFKPKPTRIKAVMGSFMLIPKLIFQKVNGFDPDFFMYAEELDLCRRISIVGYEIHFLETAVAIHKHGGSSKGKNWAYQQNYLSNSLLYLKTRGLLGYFVYHFIYFITFLGNFLLLWKMDSRYRKDFWFEKKMYFSNIIFYFKIPLLYSSKIGNGKRLLKRN